MKLLKKLKSREKINVKQWMLSKDLLHAPVGARRNERVENEIFNTHIPLKKSIWRKHSEYLGSLVLAGQYFITLTHVQKISAINTDASVKE